MSKGSLVTGLATGASGLGTGDASRAIQAKAREAGADGALSLDPAQLSRA